MENADKALQNKSLLEFKKLANNLDNLALIDTETTGFPSHTNSEVWQIGLLTFTPNGTPIKHSWYMRPRYPLPEIVTELTGINTPDLEDMPSFDEVYPYFLDIIGTKQVVAYNSDFDVPMLQKTAKAFKLSPFQPSHACVMKLYANYKQVEFNQKFGNWAWVKLSETNYAGIPSAMELEGLSVSGAHCAIDDCIMTWQLIMAVAEKDINE